MVIKVGDDCHSERIVYYSEIINKNILKITVKYQTSHHL